MKLTRFSSRCGSREKGYILLTLMLIVALMAIAAAAIAPTLAFQVQRDREEELIHRGVQYSRAVRRYYKKFGRYPTSLDDLEKSNNLRFLRRRYKDPITGKDFKLLHFGEVQMAMGGGIMGGAAPGMAIGNGPAGTTLSGNGQSSGFGQSSSGQSGGSGFSLGPSNGGAQGGQLANASQGTSPGKGQNGDDSADASAGDDQSGNGDQKAAKGDNANGSGGGSSGPGGQVFGGGPIVGVTSVSKLESVRVFNNKNHYNQWQFIYDPSTDRGGLITTPAQPPLQNAVAMQPGANGMGTSGATGQPGGFGGQSPGIGGSPGMGGASSGFGGQSSGFGQSGMGGTPLGGQQNQPQQPAQPQQQ